MTLSSDWKSHGFDVRSEKRSFWTSTIVSLKSFDINVSFELSLHSSSLTSISVDESFAFGEFRNWPGLRRKSICRMHGQGSFHIGSRCVVFYCFLPSLSKSGPGWRQTPAQYSFAQSMMERLLRWIWFEHNRLHVPLSMKTTPRLATICFVFKSMHR